MKRLILATIVSFGIVFTAIAGNTLSVPENNQTKYDIIVVEGHHYLVVVSRSAQRIHDSQCVASAVSSSISIQVLHSFGCPCMEKKNRSSFSTTNEFDVVKFMNE